MKYLIIILFALFACHETPGNLTSGCMSGVVYDSAEMDTVRVLIKCAPRDEFIQAKYQMKEWNDYTHHQWRPVKNCESCY